MMFTRPAKRGRQSRESKARPDPGTAPGSGGQRLLPLLPESTYYPGFRGFPGEPPDQAISKLTYSDLRLSNLPDQACQDPSKDTLRLEGTLGIIGQKKDNLRGFP